MRSAMCACVCVIWARRHRNYMLYILIGTSHYAEDSNEIRMRLKFVIEYALIFVCRRRRFFLSRSISRFLFFVKRVFFGSVIL